MRWLSLSLVVPGFVLGYARRLSSSESGDTWIFRLQEWETLKKKV